MTRLMRLAAALLYMLLLGPYALAQGPEGWLNARDFGASGSEFETTATTVDGSEQITVADVGDFEVGQGVMVSRCNIQVVAALMGPASPYGSRKAITDEAEIRGYDGGAGSWLIYILEIDGAEPLSFRWTDDLARTWSGTKVPVTFDWQELSNGIEVKINTPDLVPGNLIAFTLRDQLITRIEQIEGNVLTLAHAANRSADDAVVIHNDQAALQAAVDTAIREKRNLYVPPGHYRLAGRVSVPNAAITIQGHSAEHTLLDIRNGTGPCLHLQAGTEVTVRNFSMIGHTGMAEAAGSFRTSSGHGYWACALKSCNAVTISGTERVLIENVHASRMASEAFYAQWAYRTGDSEPTQYQKALTYLRCSVTDCAANGFNNNDAGENTSVLYCRIDGANWHAAEMPTKFFRFIGNYVRNSGPVTVGDMSHRHDDLHRLGCGQAIVADNVFEGIGKCGGIAVNHGSSQVVIANNLFINYNGNAINASSYTVPTSFPSHTITIKDNIIDMTYAGEDARSRTGIRISASNVIAANNQVYVRGEADPLVTGIAISEPALNVRVHDNLIRNCHRGLVTGRAAGRVTQVVDDRTFQQAGVPLEWKYSHLYRGWNVAWMAGGRPLGLSVIDGFDAETCRFTLEESWEMKVGDQLEVFPPHGPDWDIHSNTITGCRMPVIFDSYGGETAVFRNNTVSRGGATDVQNAIQSHSRFNLVGNHIVGFDEPGSAALYLCPDKLGNAPASMYRGNIIERCTQTVREATEGLWEAALREGNLFRMCGEELAGVQRPRIAAAARPGPRPVLRAPRLAAPITVDGALDEWPLDDPERIVRLEIGPAGEAFGPARAVACAAHDDDSLYLAVRSILPEGYTPVAGANWAGDGLEIAFRVAEGEARTPIFILWGTVDGALSTSSVGGATPEQTGVLETQTLHRTSVGSDAWTSEWRIPLKELGIDPARSGRLLLNIGYRCLASDRWIAWAPTGGAIYEVDNAGDLLLE